jgi:hypothetical protein
METRTQLFARKNHFIMNGTDKAELVIRDSGELPKIVLTKERVTLQLVRNKPPPLNRLNNLNY